MLKQSKIMPKKHVLDNEFSPGKKDLIRDKCNAAKVSINNFKEPFLSILTSAADGFPLNLWDK
ncbi:hypothetical protein ACHAW6_015844 [Cyclotella cf. meneghiniana]